MKKILFILTFFSAASLFAMNSFTPHSQSMGGTGIALEMGVETSLKNPALLADLHNQFLFSTTYLMDDIQTQSAGLTKKKSMSDYSIIPAVGFISSLTDDFTFGLGIWGSTGSGVDFRDTDPGLISSSYDNGDGLYSFSSIYSVFTFLPAISYKPFNELSFGLGLSINYASLSTSYDRGLEIDDYGLTAGGTAGVVGNDNSLGAFGLEGNGQSIDFGTGINLGISYELGLFTFGANYQSSVEFEFKHQIVATAADFEISGITNDKLSRPSEYGLGAAYKGETFKVTADIKNIAWSGADGYKSLGWEDQTIYSVGASYHLLPSVDLRAGYSYGKSPIGEKALRSSNYNINKLNIISATETVESRLSFGANVDVNKKLSIDFAFVYSPEVKNYAINRYSNNSASFNYYQVFNTHTQTSLGLGLNWKM